MTSSAADSRSPDDADDVLDRLGFEPSDEPDAPLLAWPRPARWPSGRRPGRHRAPGRLRPA